ncbi:hypothetical protein CAI16_08345 [Virgibacillus dokdonensis]|uniref:Uncharacterized protein n=1 Tax=Virgibacillus dokdonensis TaxID=302167 RepID=A0A3E0WR99_9BACI|nr:hypothetical protein CAI16_08345 [Virgibacillus dokdonensis]
MKPFLPSIYVILIYVRKTWLVAKFYGKANVFPIVEQRDKYISKTSKNWTYPVIVGAHNHSLGRKGVDSCWKSMSLAFFASEETQATMRKASAYSEKRRVQVRIQFGLGKQIKS